MKYIYNNTEYIYSVLYKKKSIFYEVKKSKLLLRTVIKLKYRVL